METTNCPPRVTGADNSDILSGSGLAASTALDSGDLQVSKLDQTRTETSPKPFPPLSTFKDPLPPPALLSPPPQFKISGKKGPSNPQDQTMQGALAPFESLFPAFASEADSPGAKEPPVEDAAYVVQVPGHDPTSIMASDTNQCPPPTAAMKFFDRDQNTQSCSTTIPFLLQTDPSGPVVLNETSETAACINADIENLALAFGEHDGQTRRFDNVEDDEGDLSGREQINTGRVDSSNMVVLENPLSKSDRYTVIRGRLPDNDPYMKAVASLGLIFVSNFMKSKMQCSTESQHIVTEDQRRNNFMEDVEHFNKELNREFKIPIIGGGQLSLYSLAQEVMKLGGLRNVVLNRAFRIVSQQLELPKSCTSAAYVLKNAYERLLYHYEQMVAFGVLPEDPSVTVDMKSEVLVSKKKDDRLPKFRKAQSKGNSSARTANSIKSGRIDKIKSTARGFTCGTDGVLEGEFHSQGVTPVLRTSKLHKQLVENSAHDMEATSLPTESLTPQQNPHSSSYRVIDDPMHQRNRESSAWHIENTPGLGIDRMKDAHGQISLIEGEDPFQIDIRKAYLIRVPAVTTSRAFTFDDFLASGRIIFNPGVL
jgi:ARID/BRIGHT DNA binding domain